MGEYIKKDGIYQKIAHLEELARNRYLDAPSDSPAKDRYLTQLHERTSFKHMIADECAEDVAPTFQFGPSVTYIHLEAEWKEYTGEDAGLHYCSVCGQQAFNYDNDGEVVEVLSNFCPYCGLPMTPEAREILGMRLRGEPQ